MGRKLSCLIVALILSGCIYYGRNFPETPVKSITNNVTTLKEIFVNFGEPDRRGLESGYETWTYSYQYYEIGQLRESKELYVVFDKDNTVKSYSFTSK
jgi:hypothetical protein